MVAASSSVCYVLRNVPVIPENSVSLTGTGLLREACPQERPWLLRGLPAAPAVSEAPRTGRRDGGSGGERGDLANALPSVGPSPGPPFCLERSSRGVPGHDTTGRKALSVSGARGPIPVMGPSERGGRVWSSWPWAHLPSEAGRAGGMALPSGPRAV